MVVSFDTIRHSVLLDKIAKRIQDPQVMHLVKQIIQAGGKVGVPQGDPFSPLAANIYLNEVDRTQPILPLRPGLPERQAHDYERHGTTTLFAALDIAAGKILGQCQPRHWHQEFLRFLKKVDVQTDPAVTVHLILDNYETHKHPEVRKWFAVHPRYHVHFTLTSASWLNQVERWFAEIRRKRIRRGTFRSVRDLERAIRDYIRANNAAPQPFHWVASANKIPRKVRKYQRTLKTGH